MASSKIVQHEPLRPPANWGMEERRFLAQLEEVLDDIYRRFGRLRLNDMDTDLQKLLEKDQQSVEALIKATKEHAQKLAEMEKDLEALDELTETSEQHAQKLEELEGAIPEELANESMELGPDGMFVNAPDGFLRFGAGKFGVTKKGDVNAQTGRFASALTVGGKPVLCKDSLVVSAVQPTESGVLWIKPETMQSLRYSLATGEAATELAGGTAHTFSLAAATPDTLADSTFVYRLTLPLQGMDEASENVSFSLALSKGDASVAFVPHTISGIGQWEQLTLQEEAESTVNLMSDSDPISLVLTVNGDGLKTLRIPAQSEIRLDVLDHNGQAQACTLYWIP